MDLKVGDKIRILTIEEMLKNYRGKFFGHDFFKKWGNHKFIITDAADELFGKKFKIDVDDEWGAYYISSFAVEKINSFDMKLDKNLFKL